MTTTVSKIISSNLNLVSDYSKKFYKVAPAKFPTASFALTKMGDPPHDIYVRWGEKEVLQHQTQINNALGYLATATTLVVDSTEGMRPGMLLYVPRTGEHMKITAVTNSTTIDVSRGVLDQTGGAAAALNDNDTIFLHTHPVDESMAFSNAPSPLMYSPSDVYNQLETFIEPVKISNRTLALIKRGVLKYDETLDDKRKDAMELLKQRLNRSLLFGWRATVAGTDGVNTKTGGLRWHASANGGFINTSVGDISAEVTFENTVKAQCMISGNETLYMACSPTALQSIQRLYQGGTLGYTGERVLSEIGIRVDRVIVPWGNEIIAYLEPLMPDFISAAGATVGHFFLWQPKNVKWRPNEPIGRYEPPPSGLDFTEYVMTEGGWELGPAKQIGYYAGVTALV